MTKRSTIVRGTLDLLILQTLTLEPRHGVGVAERIEQVTRGQFSIGPGSLFPALHRLEQRGLVRSEWRETSEGRRAKFYTLTKLGQTRLAKERPELARIVAAT